MVLMLRCGWVLTTVLQMTLSDQSLYKMPSGNCCKHLDCHIIRSYVYIFVHPTELHFFISLIILIHIDFSDNSAFFAHPVHVTGVKSAGVITNDDLADTKLHENIPKAVVKQMTAF